MTMNNQDLLATAFTELAYALLSHRPEPSPVRVCFGQGEAGHVCDLPEGILLLIETINDPDEIVISALHAALQTSIDPDVSREMTLALRQLVQDATAIADCKAGGTRIYVNEQGATFAGRPGALLELREGCWVREGKSWRSLDEALKALPTTSPQPIPVVYYRRDEETLPACPLLTEMLLDHSEEELLNPETPEVLLGLSCGMTLVQVQTLVALFLKHEEVSDYLCGAELLLRLEIDKVGRVETVLEDIVADRVFRASGTVRNCRLVWSVFDEADPSAQVECDSLPEAVAGLFAIAVREQQDRYKE